MIATDLDGTLLNNDHGTVPEKNIEALQKAADMGIKVVIATGRTLSVLTDILKQLPMTDYAVMANGAAAVDIKTGEKLYSQGIPEDIWRPIYNRLLEADAAFEVYYDGKSLIEADRLESFGNPAVSEDYNRELRQYITPVEDLPGYLAGNQIEKIHVFSVPGDGYSRLRSEFEADDRLMVTSSMKENFEINLKTTNKGNGLENLCKAVGLESSQVIAFGDADNDVEMLEWAGTPVAMENALPKVKALAEYITLSNDDCGVAYALEKYLNFE